jgi:hypothetical protein
MPYHRTLLSAPLGAMLLGLLMTAGCGKSSSSNTAASTLPTTTEAPTATAAAPATSLSVSGTGPIPQEPPFYPQVTVTSVSCGTGLNGRFVRVDLPAGGPGTPPRSAMAQPTAVLIVPGKATLVDHTNKTLYEQDDPSIAPARQGALVLSLTNTTSTGGDGRIAETGAVDVSGDYACPAKDVAYPGT